MASQLFFGFFPPTSERVPRHTDEDLNKRVTTQTDRSVASSATDPRLIDRRLRELDWNGISSERSKQMPPSLH